MHEVGSNSVGSFAYFGDLKKKVELRRDSVKK